MPPIEGPCFAWRLSHADSILESGSSGQTLSRFSTIRFGVTSTFLDESADDNRTACLVRIVHGGRIAH